MTRDDPAARDRRLFRVAAAWNYAIGGLLALPAFLYPLWPSAPPPPDPLASQLVAVTVLLFGWAYGRVATDPPRRLDLVRLGIAGKLAVVLLCAGHVAAGQLPPLAAWPAAVDLVFAGLFLEFLGRARGGGGRT